MSTTVNCDRCGTETGAQRYLVEVRPVESGETGSLRSSYDLCTSCSDAHGRWITTAPPGRPR